MIHQLRIYEIFEHNKAAFHQRFRDHAARIIAHIWLQYRGDVGGQIERANRVCVFAELAGRND